MDVVKAVKKDTHSACSAVCGSVNGERERRGLHVCFNQIDDMSRRKRRKRTHTLRRYGDKDGVCGFASREQLEEVSPEMVTR